MALSSAAAAAGCRCCSSAPSTSPSSSSAAAAAALAEPPPSCAIGGKKRGGAEETLFLLINRRSSQPSAYSVCEREKEENKESKEKEGKETEEERGGESCTGDFAAHTANSAGGGGDSKTRDVCSVLHATAATASPFLPTSVSQLLRGKTEEYTEVLPEKREKAHFHSSCIEIRGGDRGGSRSSGSRGRGSNSSRGGGMRQGTFPEERTRSPLPVAAAAAEAGNKKQASPAAKKAEVEDKHTAEAAAEPDARSINHAVAAAEAGVLKPVDAADADKERDDATVAAVANEGLVKSVAEQQQADSSASACAAATALMKTPSFLLTAVSSHKNNINISPTTNNTSHISSGNNNRSSIDRSSINLDGIDSSSNEISLKKISKNKRVISPNITSSHKAAVVGLRRTPAEVEGYARGVGGEEVAAAAAEEEEEEEEEEGDEEGTRSKRDTEAAGGVCDMKFASPRTPSTTPPSAEPSPCLSLSQPSPSLSLSQPSAAMSLLPSVQAALPPPVCRRAHNEVKREISEEEEEEQRKDKEEEKERRKDKEEEEQRMDNFKEYRERDRITKEQGVEACANYKQKGILPQCEEEEETKEGRIEAEAAARQREGVERGGISSRTRHPSLRHVVRVSVASGATCGAATVGSVGDECNCALDGGEQTTERSDAAADSVQQRESSSLCGAPGSVSLSRAARGDKEQRETTSPARLKAELCLLLGQTAQERDVNTFTREDVDRSIEQNVALNKGKSIEIVTEDKVRIIAGRDVSLPVKKDTGMITGGDVRLTAAATKDTLPSPASKRRRTESDAEGGGGDDDEAEEEEEEVEKCACSHAAIASSTAERRRRENDAVSGEEAAVEDVTCVMESASLAEQKRRTTDDAAVIRETAAANGGCLLLQGCAVSQAWKETRSQQSTPRETQVDTLCEYAAENYTEKEKKEREEEEEKEEEEKVNDKEEEEEEAESGKGVDAAASVLHKLLQQQELPKADSLHCRSLLLSQLSVPLPAREKLLQDSAALVKNASGREEQPLILRASTVAESTTIHPSLSTAVASTATRAAARPRSSSKSSCGRNSNSCGRSSSCSNASSSTASSTSNGSSSTSSSSKFDAACGMKNIVTDHSQSIGRRSALLAEHPPLCRHGVLPAGRQRTDAVSSHGAARRGGQQQQQLIAAILRGKLDANTCGNRGAPCDCNDVYSSQTIMAAAAAAANTRGNSTDDGSRKGLRVFAFPADSDDMAAAEASEDWVAAAAAAAQLLQQQQEGRQQQQQISHQREAQVSEQGRRHRKGNSLCSSPGGASLDEVLAGSGTLDGESGRAAKEEEEEENIHIRRCFEGCGIADGKGEAVVAAVVKRAVDLQRRLATLLTVTLRHQLNQRLLVLALSILLEKHRREPTRGEELLREQQRLLRVLEMQQQQALADLPHLYGDLPEARQLQQQLHQLQEAEWQLRIGGDRLAAADAAVATGATAGAGATAAAAEQRRCLRISRNAHVAAFASPPAPHHHMRGDVPRIDRFIRRGEAVGAAVAARKEDCNSIFAVGAAAASSHASSTATTTTVAERAAAARWAAAATSPPTEEEGRGGERGCRRGCDGFALSTTTPAAAAATRGDGGEGGEWGLAITNTTIHPAAGTQGSGSGVRTTHSSAATHKEKSCNFITAAAPPHAVRAKCIKVLTGGAAAGAAAVLSREEEATKNSSFSEPSLLRLHRRYNSKLLSSSSILEGLEPSVGGKKGRGQEGGLQLHRKQQPSVDLLFLAKQGERRVANSSNTQGGRVNSSSEANSNAAAAAAAASRVEFWRSSGGSVGDEIAETEGSTARGRSRHSSAAEAASPPAVSPHVATVAAAAAGRRRRSSNSSSPDSAAVQAEHTCTTARAAGGAAEEDENEEARAQPQLSGRSSKEAAGISLLRGSAAAADGDGVPQHSRKSSLLLGAAAVHAKAAQSPPPEPNAANSSSSSPSSSFSPTVFAPSCGSETAASGGFTSVYSRGSKARHQYDPFPHSVMIQLIQPLPTGIKLELKSHRPAFLSSSSSSAAAAAGGGSSSNSLAAGNVEVPAPREYALRVSLTRHETKYCSFHSLHGILPAYNEAVRLRNKFAGLPFVLPTMTLQELHQRKEQLDAGRPLPGHGPHEAFMTVQERITYYKQTGISGISAAAKGETAFSNSAALVSPRAVSPRSSSLAATAAATTAAATMAAAPATRTAAAGTATGGGGGGRRVSQSISPRVAGVAGGGGSSGGKGRTFRTVSACSSLEAAEAAGANLSSVEAEGTEDRCRTGIRSDCGDEEQPQQQQDLAKGSAGKGGSSSGPKRMRAHSALITGTQKEQSVWSSSSSHAGTLRQQQHQQRDGVSLELPMKSISVISKPVTRGGGKTPTSLSCRPTEEGPESVISHQEVKMQLRSRTTSSSGSRSDGTTVSPVTEIEAVNETSGTTGYLHRREKRRRTGRATEDAVDCDPEGSCFFKTSNSDIDEEGECFFSHATEGHGDCSFLAEGTLGKLALLPHTDSSVGGVTAGNSTGDMMHRLTARNGGKSRKNGGGGAASAVCRWEEMLGWEGPLCVQESPKAAATGEQRFSSDSLRRTAEDEELMNQQARVSLSLGEEEVKTQQSAGRAAPQMCRTAALRMASRRETDDAENRLLSLQTGIEEGADGVQAGRHEEGSVGDEGRRNDVHGRKVVMTCCSSTTAGLSVVEKEASALAGRAGAGNGRRGLTNAEYGAQMVDADESSGRKNAVSILKVRKVREVARDNGSSEEEKKTRKDMEVGSAQRDAEGEARVREGVQGNEKNDFGEQEIDVNEEEARHISELLLGSGLFGGTGSCSESAQRRDVNEEGVGAKQRNEQGNSDGVRAPVRDEEKQPSQQTHNAVDSGALDENAAVNEG